mgnify:CR=1 FL=1
MAKEATECFEDGDLALKIRVCRVTGTTDSILFGLLDKLQVKKFNHRCKSRIKQTFRA